MTLPEGWVETTLSEIVTFNPKHDPAFDLDQLVSFVPMPAVDEHSGTITSAIDRPLREVWGGFPHFADGDVIFAKITPCMENGKSAIAGNLKNGLACGSTEFFVLRPFKGVQASYIWRYLRQRRFRALAETQMTGAVGQRRVPRAYLENYLFRLPPAGEQRRIVAKLDALAARLARGRADVDRVRFLAAKLRRAVLERVFKRHPHTPRTYVASVCKVGTGSTPKRGEHRFYANGDVPWITSGSVNSGTVMAPTELITNAAVRETNCKVFPAGSILVALYGEGKTRGMVAVLGIAAATNQALAVLHDFGSDIRPEWIRYFLQSRYEETRAAAAGGVQPNLNLGIIKKIELPLPSLSEQAEGICRIEAAFARADRLEAEAARARALLDRLEAAILAKAFRGELVPQDPNDEPASVLLDRIRAERAAAPRPKRGRARKAMG